jgi:hypothetical protein
MTASTAASTAAARDAFARSGVPDLSDLLGRHRAEFVGDRWWRTAAPVVTAVGGMPGWWGKQFEPGDAVTLVGVNLVRRHGEVLVPSYPMRARVGPSRTDGRPALVVTYPAPAPWQWQQVVDELRPLGPGTLVGLTFTRPPVVRAGLPFLLHRDDR